MTSQTHHYAYVKRFTLVELLFASVIALFVIGGMITFSLYSLQALKRLQTDADMRLEGAQAMERFKNDLAFSASGKLILAPDENSAAAISFPILWREDHSSTPVAGEQIDWTHTVVYHLRQNDDDTQDLCRTIFSDRDNTVTEASRLTQANRVLSDGHGGNALNGANASTAVLVTNVTDLTLGKGSKTINARADKETPTLKQIGYARVSSGTHTLRFETSDDDNTPQNIGIDALFLTPSGGAIGGEVMINELTSSGGTASVNNPSPSYQWENNTQLLFSTNSPKAFVEFDIHNDMWVESEFARESALTIGTNVTTDANTGEEVVRLAGMEDAWFVEQQLDTTQEPAVIREFLPLTGTQTGPKVDFSGSEIQLVILGDKNVSGGVAGKLCKMTLRGFGGTRETIDTETGQKIIIPADTIIESASLDGVEVKFNGSPGVNIGVDSLVESDWIELEYDPAKDYRLTLKLSEKSAQYYDAAFMIGGQDGIYHKDVGYPQCPLAVKLFVSHPESGTYESRVFDTKLKAPEYATVYGLMSNIAGGKSISVKVRSANNVDMTDATDWDQVFGRGLNTSPFSLIGVATKRYVQFQVILETVDPYQETPVLRSTIITWPGPDKIVDLSGIFTHGPRYGKFTIYMDGVPLNTVNAYMRFNVIREIRGETINKPFRVSTGSHQIEADWTL